MFAVQTCSRLGRCAGLGLGLTPGLGLGLTPGRLGLVGVMLDFHTSCCCGKNLMKKFINRTRKKLWYETPPQTYAAGSQGNALKPPRRRSQEDTLRTRVLNTVLFRAVTDLLGSELTDLDVEISEVSLPADFSSVRVYWKTSGVSERDDLIHTTLDRTGPRIRYLIMSRQTLGGVPPLVFIRDRRDAAAREVDRLLALADFGPAENKMAAEQDGREPLPGATSQQPAVLFGVDHEALNLQILQYQLLLRSRGAGPEGPGPESLGAGPEGPGAGLGLTQQLQVLEEVRKQKIKEKMKKKKRPVDDDITPREFLLARHRQGEWPEAEEEGWDFRQEDAQIRELMAEDDRKS